MDNALLVNLSHQLAAQRAMDAIAGNIANASTPGYRRESLKFEEYLQYGRGADWEKGTQVTRYVKQAGLIRDMREGAVTATGNRYDLAINGDGWFAIQTANGERYTRNGHFTLNGDGQIVTEAGDPVLTDGGPLAITNEDGNITVGADGIISGDQGQLAKLRVVRFPDNRALKPEGGTLYNTDQQAVDAADGFKINQGMLEGSNVEPVREIASMIDIMRTYEAISKLVSRQEDMKEDAVSKLGSIPS